MQEFLQFTEHSFHWNRHMGVCCFSLLKLTQDYPLISGTKSGAYKLKRLKIVTFSCTVLALQD